ncbi:MAG: TolC family protein [Alphaproteobacteria bacterium]|nr:TolC family protein [Alphaproteobacteria bacterium]
MMNKLFLCGLICCLCVSPAAADFDPFSVYDAQAPEGCVDPDIGKSALGLSDLIQIGICNNPLLNKGYMAVKTAEAGYGSAQSEYLPSVSVSGSVSAAHQKWQDAGSDRTDPYAANVGLSWLLYDFGGRSARTDKMRAYLDAAQFSYKSLLSDTILEINQAYFNLLSAQEVLKSAQTSEESYQKAYEEARRRFDLGFASASDKLLARTSYEQSKLAVIRAKNAVKQNQGTLAVLLNLSPNTAFKLERPDRKKDIGKLETTMKVEEMMETALAQRSKMKKARSDLEAARQDVRQAQSGAIGSIKLTGATGYDNDMRASAYKVGSSVGIGVSVPLFTGFADTYNIAQARYQMQQAQYAVADTQDAIRNEVWTAYQNYQTAVAAHDVAKRVLDSAKENERVAFASYQVGKENILNLLTASSQFASARQELIVAYYSVLIGKATLYKAVGGF